MAENKLFITGAPRSGTTMLRIGLNYHSDIDILPETSFFSEIYSERNGVFRRKTDTILNRILNRRFLIKDYLHYADDLLQELGPEVESEFEVYDAILSKHSKATGCKVVGEKYPIYYLFYKQIKERYPESKFLHILRDPRYVMTSYICREDFPGRIFRMMYLIKKSNEFALAHRENPDVHVLEYENLVKDQNKEVAKIFQWLSLGSSDIDLEQLPLSSSHSANKGTNVDFDQRGLINGNDFDWKNKLSPRHVKLINKVDFGRLWEPRIIMSSKFFIEEMRLLKRRLGLRKLY